MIKISLFIIFLLLLPAIVIGESSCDSEEEHSDKSLALKYKIGAIASIIMVSAIGVCLPMLGKFMPALEPKKDIFFIIKAFAAGVILSTAFVHVLPDAIESLTSPCLNEHPWRKFPFAGFVAMLSAIGTLMIDSFATSYYTRCNLRKTDEENVNDNGAHTHATHAHSHSMIMVDNSVSSEFLRHRVISQVLELGIVVHSVIIGVSLGASQSPKAIKPLLVALIFHQFFEGMGLGVCIAQAKLKGRAIVIMALFFSLTTPIGIGIGIVISNGYQENDPRALIVEGIFDAASSGILIYMSLVDLLAADFMDLKVQSNTKLQFGVNLFLLLGVACMSILAKWA